MEPCFETARPGYGHRSPHSAPALRADPTLRSRAYHRRRLTSLRNLRAKIEVLLARRDQPPATSRGEPFDTTTSGHGYCSYSFFEQCPHRMALRPLATSTAQELDRGAALEAKTGLQRMLRPRSRSPTTSAPAVEDDHDAIARLIDVCTTSDAGRPHATQARADQPARTEGHMTARRPRTHARTQCYLSTHGRVAVFARHGGRRLAATARPRRARCARPFRSLARLLSGRNNKPHPQGDTP